MSKEMVRVSVTLVGRSVKPHYEISTSEVTDSTLAWFKKVFRENVPVQMEKMKREEFHVLPSEEDEAARARIRRARRRAAK